MAVLIFSGESGGIEPVDRKTLLSESSVIANKRAKAMALANMISAELKSEAKKEQEQVKE
ncbi:MAG: hypothetical protein WCJ19_04710 [bacterium]